MPKPKAGLAEEDRPFDGGRERHRQRSSCEVSAVTRVPPQFPCAGGGLAGTGHSVSLFTCKSCAASVISRCASSPVTDSAIRASKISAYFAASAP